MDELYSVLKEWGALLLILYKAKKIADYNELTRRLQKLLGYYYYYYYLYYY